MKIISKPIPFLTDRWGVLLSSMFVTIWLGLGYYMVIYLTALANIDESLYEAASLDGAGPVRQFIYVTMPGVRSTMMLIMMLSTIAAFRVFNEIYVLTNGSAGPGGMDMTMSMLIKREAPVSRPALVTRAPSPSSCSSSSASCSSCSRSYKSEVRTDEYQHA